MRTLRLIVLGSLLVVTLFASFFVATEQPVYAQTFCVDNIGVFDRSAPLPTGGHLEQADGTAWMGMYCLNMLAIALELARTKPAYEDVAKVLSLLRRYVASGIADRF